MGLGLVMFVVIAGFFNQDAGAMNENHSTSKHRATRENHSDRLLESQRSEKRKGYGGIDQPSLRKEHGTQTEDIEQDAPPSESDEYLYSSINSQPDTDDEPPKPWSRRKKILVYGGLTIAAVAALAGFIWIITGDRFHNSRQADTNPDTDEVINEDQKNSFFDREIFERLKHGSNKPDLISSKSTATILDKIKNSLPNFKGEPFSVK